VLSATTISGGTFYGDGSNLTNTPDKFITDLSFNNSNYNLTVTRSDSWTDTVSLSILSSDMTITGGTYNSTNGIATFTNNSGGTFNVSGFLVGYTDTNFAVTDLTFTGNRTHNLDGNYLFLATDLTFSNLSSFLYLDNNELQIGNYSTSEGMFLDFSGNTAFIRSYLNHNIINFNTGVGFINSNVTINDENTSQINFIVKGFNDNNLIFSDPLNDRVGVGTDTPTEKLTVSGNTNITGTLNIGTIGGGSPVINLGLDSSGYVVTGSTSGGTNFSNTNLTFTGNRNHDLNGYGMYLSTDGTSYSEGYLGIDTVSVSLGMLTPSGSSIIYQTVDPITPGIIEYSAGEEIRRHTKIESIFYVYQDRNFIIRDGDDNNDLLTVDGLQNEVRIKGDFSVSGNSVMSGSSQNVLTVIGSGNTSSPPIFSVQGSNGELFSVNDSLIGSLFSVNDISGIPIFEVFSDNTILMGSYLAPSLNTTVRVLPSVGTTNVYSLPLSAYTGAWFEYTVRSGTGARSGQIMSIFSGTTVNITETTTTSIGVTTPITFNMISDGTNATLRVSVISGTWEVRVIIRSI
jgi:hypothetical protein